MYICIIHMFTVCTGNPNCALHVFDDYNLAYSICLVNPHCALHVYGTWLFAVGVLCNCHIRLNFVLQDYMFSTLHVD